MKTYLASTNPSTSVHGFVDYHFATEEGIQLTLKQVKEDLPHSIVIDGLDDWHRPAKDRPETWMKILNFPVLAYFHTGISGLSKSGIIIDRHEFTKLQSKYEDNFGVSLKDNKNIKLYM